MQSNDQVGVAVAQPKTDFQRSEVAAQCHALLEMKMPVLVDEIDDRVGRAYSGMPDRLYVIDRQGKVAFKSGRGPFWFNPSEMEQAMIMLLLDEKPAVKEKSIVKDRPVNEAPPKAVPVTQQGARP